MHNRFDRLCGVELRVADEPALEMSYNLNPVLGEARAAVATGGSSPLTDAEPTHRAIEGGCG